MTGRSDPTRPTVLVAGGTGRQGGAVAQTLIETTDYEVRILTRRPDSAAAQRLAAHGAIPAGGDFGDVASLRRAFDGVARAFFMTDYHAAGDADTERRHGYNVIDVALDQGVDFLVYSSTMDVAEAPNVPHFDSKYAIEMRLRGADLQGTVVRPAPFFQNFEAFETVIRAGLLPFPVATDAGLPMVDVADIGTACGAILTAPARHAGETYDICADLYTLTELAGILGEEIGYKITPVSIPSALIHLKEGESLARMFQWFSRFGQVRSVASSRLAIDFTDARTYFEECDWIQGGSLSSTVGRLTAPVRPPYALRHG